MVNKRFERAVYFWLTFHIIILVQCQLLAPADTEDMEDHSVSQLFLRWQYAYKNGPGDLMLPPIAVADSPVVFSEAPVLVALQINTGEKVWQTLLPHDQSLQSFQLLYNESILTAPQIDRVIVWDKLTGEELWSYSVPEVDQGFIGFYYDALQGNDFFLTGVRTILYIRLFEGLTWAKRLPHRIGPLLVQDAIVYVGTFNLEQRDDGTYEEGSLTALNRTTGDSLWTYQTDGVGPTHSPLLIDDNSIYVGTASRGGIGHYRFYSIDKYTGHLNWQTVSNLASYHAILVGDTIFGNDSLGLYALDKRTGALLWQNDLGVGHGEDPVAYLDGYVYHTKGGALHIVDARTGEIVVHKYLCPDRSSVWYVSTGAGAVFVQTLQHLYCYESFQPE